MQTDKINKQQERKQINAVSLTDVHILDGYQSKALELEVHYLKALEPDRLLAGFAETAGQVPKAEKYPGWESTEIRGHTLGHYLTALCQGYQSSADNELLERVRYIVGELSNYQRDDGYLAAFPDDFFLRVETGKPVWVPWYTMHKLVAGLISACKTDSTITSQQLLFRLGDWIANRVLSWDEATQAKVLAVEYGGMNDCLYDLCAMSGSELHLRAAHQFDEQPLIEALAQGKDVLNNLHANTTIPKFLGSANRFLATGETSPWLDAAANFWDIVTQHHSYASGGNSEWEHFGPPDILDAERTNCNCETCNSYNMLKLSKRLFEITENTKYLRFYDRALNNSILPSQNPTSGMTTYFQPMASGYFKVYGTPFDKFWCCTGSGMENFTKLGDGIFYEKAGSLTIGRIVNSRLLWRRENLLLNMTENLLEKSAFTLRMEEIDPETTKPLGQACAITLVKPWWLAPSCTWTASDALDVSQDEECIHIRVSSLPAEVHFHFPLKVMWHPLPDASNTGAFSFGPWVFSAELGAENLEVSKTGVDVTIPAHDNGIDDLLIVENKESWLAKALDSTPSFSSNGTPFLDLSAQNRNLRLIPHYMMHGQRYGLYWKIIEAGSKEQSEYLNNLQKKRDYEASVIDRIPLGNDQYELQHEISGEHTLSDTRDGYRYRELLENCKLSYTLAVDSEAKNLLEFRYSLSDEFHMNVLVNGQLLKEISNDQPRYLEYEEISVEIPQSITQKETLVRLEFLMGNTGRVRLAGEIITRRK